jgi:hypothetical protein
MAEGVKDKTRTRKTLKPRPKVDKRMQPLARGQFNDILRKAIKPSSSKRFPKSP